MATGLNKTQELFVQEYLVDGNGKRAAIRAGYSEKTATVQASKLLTLAKVKSAIEEGRALQTENIKLRAASHGITKERWLQELSRIAFANMDDYAVVGERGIKLIETKERKRSLGAAIKKITESTTLNGGSQSIELHAKQPALETLGKHFDWLIDKTQLSGPDGKPIETKSETTVVNRSEFTELLKDAESLEALMLLGKKLGSKSNPIT